jgi:hypothetical protein
MEKPPASDRQTPILDEVVDQLLQFTDTGTLGTPPPTARQCTYPSGPVLVEVVDQLVEFTDKAVPAPAARNGQSARALAARTPSDQ